MINFEAVIRHFGPKAVALQLDEVEMDKLALEAIKNHPPDWSPFTERAAAVGEWLKRYAVFQGIEGPKRTKIAEAVLRWGDSQAEAGDLRSFDALIEAHAQLTEECLTAYGSRRNFTSLASKALWLRYPKVVPMFDSFAQRTLWVISKMERDLASAAQERRKYGKFALIWMTLYERYATVIAAIDTQGYPYRVRVFDKILWIIGKNGYTAEDEE